MPNPNEVTVSLANGQWTCSPDPIVPRGPNAAIHFHLAADGYSFRATEAVVVADGGEQFPEKSKTKDPKTAKLLDRNNRHGKFKYSVFLTQDGSGKEVEIDPIISNEEP
jgi:hypothetical protein